MLQKITEIVRRAGDIILQADGDKAVEQKSSRHDLVTKYDKAVQAFLYRELLKAVPEAGFVGEEDDVRQTANHSCRFIVDPIDGTTNFIKGLKRSCVCVAFARRGIIELGVVYNPYCDEMFTAERGRGAWLNGVPVHVSDCPMEKALAYAGMSPYYPQCAEETFRLARLLQTQCIDLRRSGSAALELCDVACGRADVYYECRLSPWDYAAASLIVEEAGGHVADMQGTPLQFEEKTSVAAANGPCWQPLLKMAALAAGK